MSEPVPGREPLDEKTARSWERFGVRSRIAAARLSRGWRQEDVSPALGISLSTYRRLENGALENPPLRYLVNCALLFDVPLTSLLGDEWLEWMTFEHGPAGPRRPIDRPIERPDPPPAP